MIPYRICVFCNKKPIDKNNEHVLPTWLLELTGGSSRPMLEFTEVSMRQRRPNFDSFVFPACTSCNTAYSKLESKAKPIVEDIIASDKLSPEDIEILFDWIDKIRIGCWLGFMMLDKKAPPVQPLFGIATRGKKDRVMWIQRSSYSGKRLTFFGDKDILFYTLPSFFGILINNTFIASASNTLLLNNCTILPGLSLEKVISPREAIYVFDYNNEIKNDVPYLGSHCTIFVQQFYNYMLDDSMLSNQQKLLIKDNLKESKILMYENRKFNLYPSIKTGKWVKPLFKKDEDLRFKVPKNYKIVREWTARKWPAEGEFLKLRDEMIKSLII